MLNPKFKKVKKDRLFYDRYRYCMRFRLPEASALRELNHADIDRILDYRIESRLEAEERWKQSRSTIVSPAIIPTLRASRWREITNEMRQDLHNVADFLIASRVDYKLVISVDVVWIYTNSLTMIDEIRSYSVYAKQFTEAVITRPKNTIALKEPKHTHRSYFKPGKLGKSEKKVIVEFLNKHLDELRPSPAMLEWMQEDFMRIHEYYFVDHNGPYWLTMFGLVKPGLIKKTYEIISAK